MPTRPNVESDSPHHPLDRREFLRKSAIVSSLTWLGSATRAQDKGAAAARTIRVRVWSEGAAPRSIYPEDVDGALAQAFDKQTEFSVARARLTDKDHGLSDAELDATDVLLWWGRLRHEDVADARASAIVERVKAGKLGFVALHGSYASKPFVGLMGQSCAPKSWREDGNAERIEIKAPEHPIAQGIEPFTIPQTAMFQEPFSVPEPETVVLVSSWNGGESFRSGLVWTIGKGRVAYFRPGHDGFPVLFHPSVRKVINNTARWAATAKA